jgi:hypothetical protein
MDTFVVRLWTPGAPDGNAEAQPGLRGTAQHVGSGRSAPFRSGHQLLDLLAELRRPGDEGAEPESTPTVPDSRRQG